MDYRNNLEYKVKWTGYEKDSDFYPAKFFTNTADSVADFHRRNPGAFKPEDVPEGSPNPE